MSPYPIRVPLDGAVVPSPGTSVRRLPWCMLRLGCAGSVARVASARSRPRRHHRVSKRARARSTHAAFSPPGSRPITYLAFHRMELLFHRPEQVAFLIPALETCRSSVERPVDVRTDRRQGVGFLAEERHRGGSLQRSGELMPANGQSMYSSCSVRMKSARKPSSFSGTSEVGGDDGAIEQEVPKPSGQSDRQSRSGLTTSMPENWRKSVSVE